MSKIARPIPATNDLNEIRRCFNRVVDLIDQGKSTDVQYVNESMAIAAGEAAIGGTSLTPGSGGAGSADLSDLEDRVAELEAGKQPLDQTLTGLSQMDGTLGIVVENGADVFTKRSIAVTTGHLTVSNPAGTAGNPTLGLPNSGVVAATYGDKDTIPQIAIDAQGRITSATGVDLDATLIALENLDATAGFVTETAEDVFTKRSIAVTEGHLTVSNPAGVAGNPTLGLPNSGVTAATYGDKDTIPQIAIDAQGRITSATGVDLDATLIALQGLDATAGFVTETAADTFTKRSLAVTEGHLTVTNPAGVDGNPTLGLPNSGVTAATYGDTAQVPTVTFDAQGRCTSASAANVGSKLLTGYAIGTSVAQLAATDAINAAMGKLQLQMNGKDQIGTGLLDGGVLSINTDTTKFDVTALKAFFADFTDPIHVTGTLVALDAQTAVSVTNLASQDVTYVGINSSGSIVQQASPFNCSQRRTIASLGALIHFSRTHIEFLNTIVNPVDYVTAQLHDLFMAIGPMNLTGNIYSPYSTDLRVTRTSGSIFKLGVNWQTSHLQPHRLDITGKSPDTQMRYRLQDGTEYSDTSYIDPNYYDLSGVKTLVPNNKYTVQRLYLFQSGMTRIQYGQEVYEKLADAISAYSSVDFITESNMSQNGLLRAYLVLQQGCTNLADATTAVFYEAGKFGGATATGGSGSGITFDVVVSALGYVPEPTNPRLTEYPTLCDNTHFTSGHLNRTSSSFGLSTRTFTISPTSTSFSIYLDGLRYAKTGSADCQVTFGTDIGKHYIYFNASAVLTTSTTVWEIENGLAPTAVAWWNGSAARITDERHSAQRNLAWHDWAHDTIGCRWQSGLAKTYPTIANPGYIQIESGIINDEDIVFSISQQKKCVLWYETAASVYTWANGTDNGGWDRPYIWNSSTSRLRYAKSDSSYTLTDVDASKYVCAWVYASTDKTPGDERPIYIVFKSITAPYNTAALARGETEPSIKEYLSPELKLIYRWIYKGDGSFVEEQDYRTSSSLPGGTSVTLDHNNTTNIQGGTTGERYHTTQAQNAQIEALHANIMSRVSLGFL